MVRSWCTLSGAKEDTFSEEVVTKIRKGSLEDYDQIMSSIFNDDYYGEGDDENFDPENDNWDEEAELEKLMKVCQRLIGFSVPFRVQWIQCGSSCGCLQMGGFGAWGEWLGSQATGGGGRGDGLSAVPFAMTCGVFFLWT